jgi:hypothetical protein
MFDFQVVYACSTCFTYSDPGATNTGDTGSLVSQELTGLSANGNTATATLAHNDLYHTGDWVLITGATPTALTTVFQVANPDKQRSQPPNTWALGTMSGVQWSREDVIIAMAGSSPARPVQSASIKGSGSNVRKQCGVL